MSDSKKKSKNEEVKLKTANALKVYKKELKGQI
jgi:hypothetical protein